jgi:hypothetical protein
MPSFTGQADRFVELLPARVAALNARTDLMRTLIRLRERPGMSTGNRARIDVLFRDLEFANSRPDADAGFVERVTNEAQKLIGELGE